MLPVSAVTSHVLSRTGRYRWPTWIGWLCTALAAGHLALITKDTHIVRSALTFILFGLGTGMTLPSMNFGVQAMVTPQEAPLAASMYTFVRSVGMSFGIAVGSNVFQAVMKSSLHSHGLPESVTGNAEKFIVTLPRMNNDEREEYTQAYLQGLLAVYYTMAAIAGTTFLLSLFIQHHRPVENSSKHSKTKI